MLQARRLFERMDNQQLDKLFQIVVSSGVIKNVSVEGDFDFHSISLLKMLGLKRFLQIAKIVSENQVRSFLNLMKPSLLGS